MLVVATFRNNSNKSLYFLDNKIFIFVVSMTHCLWAYFLYVLEKVYFIFQHCGSDFFAGIQLLTCWLENSFWFKRKKCSHQYIGQFAFKFLYYFLLRRHLRPSKKGLKKDYHSVLDWEYRRLSTWFRTWWRSTLPR